MRGLTCARRVLGDRLSVSRSPLLPLFALLTLSCGDPDPFGGDQGRDVRADQNPRDRSVADRAQARDRAFDAELGADQGIECDPPCETGERCLALRQGNGGMSLLQCFPLNCPEARCAEGEVCDEGDCVDTLCAGIRCGQVDHSCIEGRCLPDPCFEDPETLGCPQSCFEVDGRPRCDARERCVEGRCLSGGVSWGALSSGSAFGIAGGALWQTGFRALPTLPTRAQSGAGELTSTPPRLEE